MCVADTAGSGESAAKCEQRRALHAPHLGAQLHGLGSGLRGGGSSLARGGGGLLPEAGEGAPVLSLEAFDSVGVLGRWSQSGRKGGGAGD